MSGCGNDQQLVEFALYQQSFRSVRQLKNKVPDETVESLARACEGHSGPADHRAGVRILVSGNILSEAGDTIRLMQPDAMTQDFDDTVAAFEKLRNDLKRR